MSGERLIEPANTASVPTGFRESNSGLIVPEAFSRQREVWTEDEQRLLERATKLVNQRGWYLTFTCPHPRCQAQPIVQHRKVAGGMELECEHKTVVCLRAAPPARKRR